MEKNMMFRRMITENTPDNKIRLNLGCGYDKKDGFINIDIIKNVKPDLVIDIGKEKLPYKDNSVDFILADNVFEHMPPPPMESNFENALNECHRVLNKEGKMLLILPYCTNYGADYEYHWLRCRYDIFKGFEGKGMDKNQTQFKKIERKLVFPRFLSIFNLINKNKKIIWVYERTMLRYLFPAVELRLIFKK